MSISFGSSAICFDFARDCLDRLPKPPNSGYSDSLWELEMGMTLLETFDVYTRKCRRRSNQGDAKCDRLRASVISFRIQDLVWQSINGLDSAVSRYIQSGAWDLSDIRCEIIIFTENMKLFSETDIKGLDVMSFLLYYSLGHLQLIIDFFDSISMNLKCLLQEPDIFDAALEAAMKTLQEKLMFLKSFIRFATVQGVEGQPLIDLLDHVEVVAVNVASLISTSWFQRKNVEMCNEVVSEISQIIQKMIDPDHPQVLEIYTRVLEASKLSRSSCTLALEENGHLVVEFIDYLWQSMTKIISEGHKSFLIKVKDQMLKLFEGVRFLSILLSQQHEKFNGLNDAIKDLIGVVVSDVGIVIFSLSVDDMAKGLCSDTNLVLSNLLQVFNFIIAEVAHIYPLILSSSSSGFPRTNELGSLDFFLETLKELVSSTTDSIAFPKDQIHTIIEDLGFLRSFLGNIVEQHDRDERLQALWSRVMKVAYSAELEIDSVLLGDKHELCLDAVAEDIHLMKIEAEDICDSIRYDCETQRITNTTINMSSEVTNPISKTTINMPSQVTAPIANEALVGLNDEVKSIIDRLLRGRINLDVVAIVGMPGLGKTTLAKEVYGDPSVNSGFHICAWCHVSQTYSKRSLLVQILRCIHCGRSVEYPEMDDDNMAYKLRSSLMKHRYLIVLDDVWDNNWWDLLKDLLPDDRNGSRILLTSRFQNLSLQIKASSKPHHLRPLADGESYKLLQKKLFAKEDCPPTLNKVVMQVAKYCKGLPLTVNLVAGILATTKQDCWEEVVRCLISRSFISDEHCMKTLELSYNNLPNYLKPCLLYFGAFEEGQEIPVRKMSQLWISEGFVQEIEEKSLEDVADDYLMDLISRSLVITTQQRSLGGVKTCRMHDLIHEFCVVKGKEESFLHSLHEDDLLTFTGPSYTHRLSIHSTTTVQLTIPSLLFPNLRCLLSFGDSARQLDQNSFIFLLSKLLRVLDLGNYSSRTSYFPTEVTFLVHLRYLRIGEFNGDVPCRIANLSRLITFVVVGSRSCLLPSTIWNIKTLRHLITDRGFRFSIDNLEGSPVLKCLNTLTLAIGPPSQNLQKILSKLPLICRLTIIPESGQASKYVGKDDGILVLNYLSRLESLKMSGFVGYDFDFPLNLKKLTLSDNRQSWGKISAIGKLPNLEVLKLCYDSFLGEKWEMEEGEFPSLRFLKLSGLDIRWWFASSDSLVQLEKLVLNDCRKLKEVPSSLGYCVALDMIEVKRCSESAIYSVKQILEEQQDMGNENLQIFLE